MMGTLLAWILANGDVVSSVSVGVALIGGLVAIAHKLIDRLLKAQDALSDEIRKLRTECQKLRLRVWALERQIRDAGLPLPPLEDIHE